tara:strand:- start:68 stop:373 length:306 start_codon:yes stop_codon:yes gene_type:complete
VPKLNEVLKEIIKEEIEKLSEAPPAGPRKKVLRRVGGALKIVKKRKKKLPLHLQSLKPSQRKRIARKAALKRKGKQARISKKAAKTTKKGRSMGIYKKRGS